MNATRESYEALQQLFAEDQKLKAEQDDVSKQMKALQARCAQVASRRHAVSVRITAEVASLNNQLSGPSSAASTRSSISGSTTHAHGLNQLTPADGEAISRQDEDMGDLTYLDSEDYVEPANEQELEVREKHDDGDVANATLRGAQSTHRAKSVALSTTSTLPAQSSDNGPIHASYPTVISVSGRWMEISCGLCGANANKKKGTFFHGLTSMHLHMIAVHKDILGEKFRVANTMQECFLRIVDASDIALLRRGEAPSKTAISMRFGSAPARSTPFSLSREVVRKPVNDRTGAMTHLPLPMPEAGRRRDVPIDTTISSVDKTSECAYPTARSSGFPGWQSFANRKPQSAANPLSSCDETAQTSRELRTLPPAKRPTEYEIFQTLEAEAQAAGSSSTKKQKRSQRTSATHVNMSISNSNLDQAWLRELLRATEPSD